jgi:chromosome partitioning protein
MQYLYMASESILRAATYVPKGGVGKTTTAAHMAVVAHRIHDLRTVIVDLAGKQNDLALQFGIHQDIFPNADPEDLAASTEGVEDNIEAPISAVFGEDWDFIHENIPDIVDRMVFETGEGPDLIPADPGLGGADNNLANVPREDRFHKLERFVSEDLAPEYDLVFFDLPGKEDNIALNGLFAASNTVVPLKPGKFERRQLATLHADLKAIRDEYEGVSPEVKLVFATMYRRGRNLSQNFLEEIEGRFPDVVGEHIVDTQNIGNEQFEGQTLFALDESDLYSTGREAQEAYRKNTELLLERIADRPTPQ